MRFKCRATYEERVLEAEDMKRWQRWFAWRPVMMPWGECVWLETIERRYPQVSVSTYPHFEIQGYGIVEYRLISKSS